MAAAEDEDGAGDDLRRGRHCAGRHREGEVTDRAALRDRPNYPACCLSLSHARTTTLWRPFTRASIDLEASRVYYISLAVHSTL